GGRDHGFPVRDRSSRCGELNDQRKFENRRFLSRAASKRWWARASSPDGKLRAVPKVDQTGGVVTSVNLEPKENGGRPGMTIPSREFGRAEWCRVFAVIPCFMGLREARNRPLATWRAQHSNSHPAGSQFNGVMSKPDHRKETRQMAELQLGDRCYMHS